MENTTKKLVELDFFDNDSIGGVDGIAFVHDPATEISFVAFDSKAVYDKYPEAIKAQARKGIKLNAKVNNKCATDTGKQRGQDLAKGRPLSLDVVKRMYAYLSRAKEWYKPNKEDACGTISYLLWGGIPALEWTEKVLKKLRDELSGKVIPELGGLELPGLRNEDGDLLMDELGDIIFGDGIDIANTPRGNFEFSKEAQQELQDFFLTKVVLAQETSKIVMEFGLYETKEQALEFGHECFEYKIAGTKFYATEDINDEILLLLDLHVLEELAKLTEENMDSLEVNEEEATSDELTEETFSHVNVEFNVAQKEKQMIVAPVMVPNMPILRRDEEGELYYAYFKKDVIERMAHKFLKNKHVDNINLEHDQAMMLEGAYVSESWISVGENDKSKEYGFNLPAGTWFVAMKVQDDNLWNLIKKGIVRGISLEGGFFNK